MAASTSDPTRWLTDLLTADQPLSPLGPLAQAPEAIAAAVTPWVTAAAELTAWQLNALSTVAQNWTPAWTGTSAARSAIPDRRFAAEQWHDDPRYEALARTYLTQTELMSKAL